MHSEQLTTYRRRLTALTISVIIVVAVALVTPWGQAWARQIWRFFAYQSSDTLPLSTPRGLNQVQSTWIPQPTATAITLAGCGDWGKPLCTIEQVQERVDFPLQQFSTLPDGVTFQGAYEQDGMVLIRYAQGLDLSQGMTENLPYVMTEVGASAQVEPVQIGPNEGEYVRGAWFIDAQQGRQIWRADEGLQTLRWQTGEIAFSLTAYDERWTRADLEALAKSLTFQTQRAEPDLSHLTSLEEAEAFVGYPVRRLDPVPSGYIFHFASVDLASRSVCLHYLYTRNDGPGPYLRIAIGPAEMAPELALLSAEQDPQSADRQPVEIGGAQEGEWINGLKRPGWACAETVNGYAEAPSLTFTMQGQRFDLYALLTGCVMPEGFTHLGALRLAENLTGSSTHSEGEADPECLERGADAQQLAGFPVKEPGWLPPGLAFAHVSVHEDKANPSATILIESEASRQTAFTITMSPVQEGGRSIADMVAGIPDGGYDRLEIKGLPAVLVRGDWVINENGEKEWYQSEFFAETLYWEWDGLLITIAGPWFAGDGGDSLPTLVAIAEGLR